MAQGLPRTLAAVLVAAGMVHCSLIAPSDQELMGGNKGSGSDAGDAGRTDAMDGALVGDGACGNLGDCCNLPGDCCSGLVCNTNAGTCVTCLPNGSSCFGSSNTCCGTCVGHTCR